MDTYECIMTRRSVRKFLDKYVPRDLISRILQAGTMAPSAGNLQNWKFILVEKKPLIKQLAEASLQQYWMENASAVIVIIAEPANAKRFYGLRGERLYATQNCAAAAQNMLLMAHSLGLGACWVGAFDEQKVSRIIHIPEEYRAQVLVAVGYPDETPVLPARFPLENQVHFNRWRSRLEDVDAYMGFHSTRNAQLVENANSFLQKSVDKLKAKAKEALARRKKGTQESDPKA